MANKIKLCMGCMSPLFDENKCGVCGYEADTPYSLDFLPPDSLLADNYIVGKVYSYDPEGVWYVGYDQANQVRVWLREYAPANIIRRDHETFEIIPLESSQAQYKALLSDFEDLCHSIQRLNPSEKVIPIVDMFRANNTTYAVYAYIKTITLEDFLQRSGGKLSWRHTKKLLMPLFHTVSNIHKTGLIHRGLSPETILLDQSGALWLSNFTIAAARTHKSELSAQLFEGYAAPEQYSLNSWQGTWTDVYALGAVTYRAVVGKNPPSAQDRIYGDDLLDAGDLQAEMTENTIYAINHALAVEVEDRSQTAESYIAELLVSTTGSDTAVYTAPVPKRSYAGDTNEVHRDEIRRAVAARELREQAQGAPRNNGRFDEYEDGIDLIPIPNSSKQTVAVKERNNPSDRRKKKEKRPHTVLMVILAFLVATVFLGGGMWWFANAFLGDLISPDKEKDNSSGSVNIAGEDFDSEAFASADDNKVPGFIGVTVSSIKSNEELQTKYHFEYVEDFNAEYDEGVVYDQNPASGAQINDGATITLSVSKGTEKVEMPEVVDLELEEAIKLLNDLEIEYQVIEVFNDSYEPGLVARTDKEAGTMLSKGKDKVILYTRLMSEDEQEEEEEDRKSSSSKNSSSENLTGREGYIAPKPGKPGGFYDESGNWIVVFDD